MGKKFNIGAKLPKGKQEKCDWQDCDTKHDFEIYYPDDGEVTRKTLKEWMHPSVLFSGKPYPYKTEKYKNGVGHQNYRFQRHHVIPVNVFELLPKLSHNLKLMGYDINDESNNGFSLPTDEGSIVFHDLQYHRGSHPDYNETVKEELDDLEGKCIDFCKNGSQIKLLEEIEESITSFRNKILNWRIIIRPGAKAIRKAKFKEHSDSKKIPPKIKRIYP